MVALQWIHVVLSSFSIGVMVHGQREERPLEGGFGNGIGFPMTALGQAAAAKEGAMLKEMWSDGSEMGKEGWALDNEMRIAVVEEKFEEWLGRMQESAKGEIGVENVVGDGDDYPMRATQRFVFDDNFFCNAVLLSNSIVLTSRYCLQIDENNNLPEIFFGRSRLLIGEPGTHQWNFKARFKRVEWSTPAEGWALLELEDKTVTPNLGWLGVRWTNAFRFDLQGYPMLSNIAFEGQERKVKRECRVLPSENESFMGKATCSALPGSGALITLDWMQKPIYPPYVSGWFAQDNSFIYTDTFRIQLRKAVDFWGDDLIDLPEPEPITERPKTFDPKPDTFPPRYTVDPTRFTIDPTGTIPPVDEGEKTEPATTVAPTEDVVKEGPVTDLPESTTSPIPDTQTDLPAFPDNPIAIPAPNRIDEEEGARKEWVLPVVFVLIFGVVSGWCIALLRPCCVRSNPVPAPANGVAKDDTQDFPDDESVDTSVTHPDYLNVA